MERRDDFELNPLKVNPHRVQLYSINEIWRCVQGRLIELKIMKDPELESENISDGESTDVEDDIDFKQFASERLPELFKGKQNLERHLQSVENLLKKNDLRFVKTLI